MTSFDPLTGVIAALSLCSVVASQTVWRTIEGAEPFARTGHAATFDSNRDRLVLYGGMGQFLTRAGDRSTWEWDGRAWECKSTELAPPSVHGLGLAYDASRHRCIGLSYSGQTWEWDGSAWTEIPTASTPPARDFPNLVFDSGRNRVVMFGGYTLLGGAVQTRTLHNDLWEFDGTDWTRRAPVTSPAARLQHVMTYDSVNQRVLVVGGADDSGPLNDAWAWDGVQWTQLPAPSGVYGRGMCFDESRGRAVLVGENLQTNATETWEFDGSSWQRSTATVPAWVGRVQSLVYDSAGARVLAAGCPLYGIPFGMSSAILGFDGSRWSVITSVRPIGLMDEAGVTFDPTLRRPIKFGGATTFGPIGGTQTFDGSSWNAVATATEPAPRSGHTLVQDRAGQRVVMFGGLGSGNAVLGDTWLWDGVDWSLRSPANAPSSRSHHAAAYDERSNRVVLFGGIAWQLDPPFRDTWIWDGSSWQLLPTAHAPDHGNGSAMAFDASRNEFVLFGGRPQSSPRPTDETWTFDGVDWTRRQPSHRPPGRIKHNMVFDPIRNRIVMHGGVGLDDTWEWDGQDWTEIVAYPRPSNARLLFDEATGRTFGFIDGSETWEFTSPIPPALVSFSSACGRASLGLPPLQYPALGRRLTLVVEPVLPQGPIVMAFGASRAFLDGLLLPIGLDTFGMPGCVLAQSSDFSIVLTADAGGVARLGFGVPAWPSLLGATLHAQALAFEPSANPLGLVTTNAVSITVGN